MNTLLLVGLLLGRSMSYSNTVFEVFHNYFCSTLLSKKLYPFHFAIVSTNVDQFL